MTFDSEKLLDSVSLRILQALQEHARIPFAELGRLVGLSAPAVAERVRKLEGAGIIKGYYAHVQVEPQKRIIIAFLRIRTSSSYDPRLLTLMKNMPEIVECHHVTGIDSFIVKVIVETPELLETVVAQISHYGETTTSIVLSSPVIRN